MVNNFSSVKITSLEKVLQKAEKKLDLLPKLNSNYLNCLSLLGNTFELYELLASEFLTTLSVKGFGDYAFVFRRILSGLRISQLQFIKSTFEIYKKNVYLAGEAEFQKQIKFEAMEEFFQEEMNKEQQFRYYMQKTQEVQSNTKQKQENKIRIFEEGKIVDVDNDKFNYCDYINRIITKKENIMGKAQYSTCKTVISTVLSSMVNTQADFNNLLVSDNASLEEFQSQITRIQQNLKQQAEVNQSQLQMKRVRKKSKKLDKIQTKDEETQYDLTLVYDKLTEKIAEKQKQKNTETINELHMENELLKQENIDLQFKIRFLENKFEKLEETNENHKQQINDLIAKSPLQQMSFRNLQQQVQISQDKEKQLTDLLEEKKEKIRLLKQIKKKNQEELFAINQQSCQLQQDLKDTQSKNSKFKEQLLIHMKEIKQANSEFQELNTKYAELKTTSDHQENEYLKELGRLQKLVAKLQELQLPQQPPKTPANNNNNDQKKKPQSNLNNSDQKKNTQFNINNNAKRIQNNQSQKINKKLDEKISPNIQSKNAKEQKKSFQEQKKMNNSNNNLPVIEEKKLQKTETKSIAINCDEISNSYILENCINISNCRQIFQHLQDKFQKQIELDLPIIAKSQEIIQQNEEIISNYKQKVDDLQLALEAEIKKYNLLINNQINQKNDSEQQLNCNLEYIQQIQQLESSLEKKNQSYNVLSEAYKLNEKELNEEKNQKEELLKQLNKQNQQYNQQLEELEQKISEKIQLSVLNQGTQIENSYFDKSTLNEETQVEFQDTQMSEKDNTITNFDLIKENESFNTNLLVKQTQDVGVQTIFLITQDFKQYANEKLFSKKFNNSNLDLDQKIIQKPQSIQPIKSQLQQILKPKIPEKIFHKPFAPFLLPNHSPRIENEEYEQMYLDFKSNGKINEALKDLLLTTTPAPEFQIMSLKNDYQSFKKFVISVQDKHKKCGPFCIHLQRFFWKIGFNIPQLQQKHMPEFKVHKTVINQLPSIYSNLSEINIKEQKETIKQKNNYSQLDIF